MSRSAAKKKGQSRQKPVATPVKSTCPACNSTIQRGRSAAEGKKAAEWLVSLKRGLCEKHTAERNAILAIEEEPERKRVKGVKVATPKDEPKDDPEDDPEEEESEDDDLDAEPGVKAAAKVSKSKTEKGTLTAKKAWATRRANNPNIGTEQAQKAWSTRRAAQAAAGKQA